jgi:itaconate CoA-transferase
MTKLQRFRRNSARVAHQTEVNSIIAKRFAELTSDELCVLLEHARIAWARLNSVSEFLVHPVLGSRDRWRDVVTPSGMIRALTPPVILEGIDPRMGPVPGLGEHTVEILRALGRTDREISELVAANIV